jgi:hypothetical protein
MLQQHKEELHRLVVWLLGQQLLLVLCTVAGVAVARQQWMLMVRLLMLEMTSSLLM